MTSNAVGSLYRDAVPRHPRRFAVADGSAIPEIAGSGRGPPADRGIHLPR